MCVLRVRVNKDSDMYTPARAYLLPGLPPHVFLQASSFLEALEVSELSSREVNERAFFPICTEQIIFFDSL